MEIENNLQAYIHIPAFNICKQASAFTDTTGYQVYDFHFSPKEANGDWFYKDDTGQIKSEIIVIFRGFRKVFTIPKYSKLAIPLTITFRYGKYDKQFYLRQFDVDEIRA